MLLPLGALLVQAAYTAQGTICTAVLASIELGGIAQNINNLKGRILLDPLYTSRINYPERDLAPLKLNLKRALRRNRLANQTRTELLPDLLHFIEGIDIGVETTHIANHLNSPGE